MAPFVDSDADGIYEPADGEYPHVAQSIILPEVIAWSVFNDVGNVHQETGGVPMQVEVRQTTWGYSCTDHPWLNEAVFTSYQITNVSVESLDSLYVGFWSDFDLGCFDDDFVGSVPELSAYYTYNADDEDGADGSCSQGVPLYEGTLPAQAITFLNQSLDRAMAITLDPNMTWLGDPFLEIEFYRYLSGAFRDGIRPTGTGDGWNPGSSLPFEDYVFPDNPNDVDGWSMFAAEVMQADRRALGSHHEASFAPGASLTLDLAFSVHHDPDSNHLQVFNLMYEELEELREMYSNGFTDACEQVAVCESDCVYPGDANADGIANHYDLLNLIYQEGETGPRRRPSLAWTPINAEDWSAAQQTSTANQKHADCNADGMLDAADFEVTRFNYGLTRPDYMAPADVYPEGDDVLFRYRGEFVNIIEELGPGGVGFAPVRLQLNELRSDVHAIGFQLEYDTAFLSVQLFGVSDSYEEEGSLIYYQKERSGELDFVAAIADTAEVELIQTLQSQIFIVRLKGNADQGIPGDTTCIRIKNVEAYDIAGNPTVVGSQNLKVTFSDQVVVRAEEPRVDSGRFQAFPNPATDQLQLRWQQLVVTDYTLFDLAGQRLQQGNGRWTERMELDVAQLPAGIYFLALTTADGAKGETIRFVKL